MGNGVVWYRNELRRKDMGNENVATVSTKLQKAVCWISEVVQEHPEKKRKQILREAQVRFDLTPTECEFLEDKFSGTVAGKGC